MADAPVVHIGENSPEHIAFQLMLRIAHAEDVALSSMAETKNTTRKWILDTYAECLEAVRHPQDRLP